MSTREMMQYVGMVASVQVESWIVPMKIVDVKESWGRLRFLVTPIHGTGTAWIEEQRIRGYQADISVELRNAIGE